VREGEQELLMLDLRTDSYGTAKKALAATDCHPPSKLSRIVGEDHATASSKAVAQCEKMLDKPNPYD
jgi:hypothetical protein